MFDPALEPSLRRAACGLLAVHGLAALTLGCAAVATVAGSPPAAPLHIVAVGLATAWESGVLVVGLHDAAARHGTSAPYRG